MNRLQEIAKIVSEEYDYLNTEIDAESMGITLKHGHYMWKGQDLLRLLALSQAYGLDANVFTNCETRTPMLTIAKRYTNN